MIKMQYNKRIVLYLDILFYFSKLQSLLAENLQTKATVTFKHILKMEHKSYAFYLSGHTISKNHLLRYKNTIEC